jgi:hypothetical protein
MHINTTFGCKLCGFQIRVRKFFQKVYIKHIREHHLEMSAAEMDMFEFEIKKLTYRSVCPDLPLLMYNEAGSSVVLPRKRK